MPFNPSSKEVFPVNRGKRDPNTKARGQRGGGGGADPRRGLAVRATQLALHSLLNCCPDFFHFYPEKLENIHKDGEEATYNLIIEGAKVMDHGREVRVRKKDVEKNAKG